MSCKFDKKDGFCYAIMCFSDEKCKGRNEHGKPKYADLTSCEKLEKELEALNESQS